MMKNKKQLLSVVIPVYNEEKTILTIIKRVLNSGIENLEIVVVDDFSQDKSRKILRKMKKADLINKLVLREKNGGKGAALRDGFEQVSGDIVIIQDADLEYDPQEYKKLMEPILEGRADVVYGSRFIGSGAHRVVYYWHFLANSLLTTFSNIFTNLNLTDMETGYKVFKKEVLDQIEIEENSFGIEPEVTAKIAKMKVRIYEVGISYNGRTYEEGKKIGLKDAFRAVWVILKFNLFG
jgi:glycosyltransferase involved in cell wall biosynthesis